MKELKKAGATVGLVVAGVFVAGLVMNYLDNVDLVKDAGRGFGK